MSVRVLSGRVLAVALLAASGVLGLTACGGGGGDGGGGPGGGGSGGGAAGAPPLPAVNYSGRTALATVNEQDAYLLADALDSAVVLTIDLGEIADPFILELGTTGSFDETLQSPEGGSVRRRGARTAEATGWVELSYSGWREDGTVTDGRLVIEALTPPQTAQTLRARASLHDLRIRDGDTVDRTFTGTLTREVTGLRGTFGEDRSVYTGRFLQRDNLAGQTRLIGPVTLNDGPFFAHAPSEPARQVRISGEVSLSDLGRLQIPDSGPMGYVRQGGFGVDWKFRGSLTGTGAASAALRLTGLSVDWGVLELDTNGDGRYSRTSAVRWPEDNLTLQRRPDPGGRPVALAGPRQRVRAGEPTPIEGRFSEHTAGRFVSQSWEIVLQPPAGDAELQRADSPTPLFTAGRYGSYLLRQRVSDGTNEAEDWVEVVVTEVVDEFDQRPYIGPDQRRALGAPVRLDLGRSTWLSGSSRPFLWPRGDGIDQLESEDNPIFVVTPPPLRGSWPVYVAHGGPGPTNEEWHFDAWDAMQIHVDAAAAFLPLGYFTENGLELDAIHDLALEDLTGNGVADLLISGRFGGSDTAVLRLYPGVSQGRFAPPIDTVVDDTGWLAVADLRGNGTPQVLLRSRAGVSILRVDAGGGLTALEFLPRSTDCEALEDTGPPRQGLGLFIGEVHVADVDGDGRLDIVHYYRCVDGYIEVFRQTPDGGWSAPVASTIWPDAGWPGPLALADLDGNGRTEIAFAAQTLEFPFLDVFLGRAREDGGFDFELMNAGASAPPLFVDLDGDGRVDLLLSDESRLLIRHGLGDGSFAAPVTVSALTDLPIQRIFTLSLSDGELPTIMVAGQGRFELVEQRAPRLYEAAGLTVPTYNIATPHTMRIVATDLTGDGRNDLLIAGRQWAGMTVQRPLPPLEGMGVSGSLEPRTSAAGQGFLGLPTQERRTVIDEVPVFRGDPARSLERNLPEFP